MAKSFEFFFDIVSPTAYLAWHAAPGVAERTGADMILRPIFLGGVMQATGNSPPGTVPAKGNYLGIDLQRCARHLGIAFHMNPAFPFNTRPALRAGLGLAGEPEAQRRFFDSCFQLAWGARAPRDFGLADTLVEAAQLAGLDADRINALASDEANKAALKANTEEAVARGTFGAPTFFVGDEIFFGHDRLDYVERALLDAG